METEKAVFAAGCFWGVEELFRKTKGVISTRAGFTGGKTINPSYEEVCSGNTGHAEAVEVVFDQKKISFNELLEVFWQNHDPTTLNRQGFDVGTQYRSAVFYANEKQKEISLKSKEKKEKESGKKFVTEIVAFTEFFEAEEYHQKYLMKKGLNACH